MQERFLGREQGKGSTGKLGHSEAGTTAAMPRRVKPQQREGAQPGWGHQVTQTPPRLGSAPCLQHPGLCRAQSSALASWVSMSLSSCARGQLSCAPLKHTPGLKGVPLIPFPS